MKLRPFSGDPPHVELGDISFVATQGGQDKDGTAAAISAANGSPLWSDTVMMTDATSRDAAASKIATSCNIAVGQATKILLELAALIEVALLTAARAAKRPPAATPPHPLGSGALPEIMITDRTLSAIVADLEAAVELRNDPPRIFQRAGVLVRVRRDDRGIALVETLNKDAATGELDRMAHFVREDPRSPAPKPVFPPAVVVASWLAQPDHRVPALYGISGTPPVRPDGTIVQQPGYDPITHMVYAPGHDLAIPPIPDTPSVAERDAAVSLLRDVFCDFPIMDDAGRAHIWAALLAPLLRPAIAGACPAIIISKTKAGTGASLLTDVIHIIATGEPAAMMTAPSTPEEWRKQLTTSLLEMPPIMVIDNADMAVGDPSLSSAITALSWKSRRLGTNDNALIPVRTTWIINGNNVQVSGDMARRCIVAKLDTQMEQPWLRDAKDFKHHPLLGFVQQHRGALIAAALTLARAWYAAGCPPVSAPSLGTFERFREVIGGILQHAGIPGFLENARASYEQAADSSSEWPAFLEALYARFGALSFTSVQLASTISPAGLTDGTFGQINRAILDTLPEAPAVAVAKSRSLSRALGIAFASVEGTIFAGMRIVRERQKEHNLVCWKVECKEENSPISEDTDDFDPF